MYIIYLIDLHVNMISYFCCKYIIELTYNKYVKLNYNYED